MIAGVLTYLDAALLAIVAISGLVAMYRGFTREVLSILSWVAAGLALLYFIRSHRGLAEEVAKQFSNPVQTVHVYIAQVAIGAIIFLFVLIVVHLITSHISDTVLDSRVGAIDRILGFAFGVAARLRTGRHSLHVCRLVRVQGRGDTALSQGCQPGELPRWVEEAQISGADQPDQRDALRHPFPLRALRAVRRATAGPPTQYSPQLHRRTPWQASCNLAYIQGAPRTRVLERNGGAGC